MKNKLVYIVLFVLLFSFILSAQCFAVDSSVLSEGMYSEMSTTDKDFFEQYSYYCIISRSTGDVFYLVYAETPITVKKILNEDNGFYDLIINCSEGSSGRYNIFNYNTEDNSYTNSQIGGLNGTESAQLKIYGNSSETFTFTDANCNIVDSETGEVFITPPPVGILAPIVEEVETEKTLEEVVLILPIILLTLVGLIGLRKALRMLSTVLRQS